ncbi:DNA-binding protein [Spiroplasma gladiatoris]|uniref:UPF0122 protein SGLAD_v1c07980 n=1 Tax=Spiroplasma gladiatoris TaxID=2143 RepID=A0A4P7AI98_9MOLU|nr:sigma factor-like helix-turn-helix DNA-binding protein [Spiroplasma gladiatoris]QBQ07997.1 DNA-binding protein [Spiroplasma gladiatoris]
MNNIFKNEQTNILYDYYKNLLTQKQQEYYELYFFEDLTLQEIAEQMEVSRTAVHDSINKTILNLLDFETKLQLSKKFMIIKNTIDDYKNNNLNVDILIKKIEEQI